MTAFRIQAAEAWQALYRRTPPWRPAHFAALDDAERVCGGTDAAMESWACFLAMRDNKYFNGHSPILFAKHIEEFVSIPQVNGGLRPKEIACHTCDGNGWKYVTSAVTPRGLACDSAAAPCDHCHLGKRIASRLREDARKGTVSA